MVVVQDTLYLCPSLHQSRQTEAEDCFQHVIDDFSARGKLVDLRTPRWRELCEAPDSSLRAKSPEAERRFLADLHERAAMLDEGGGGGSGGGCGGDGEASTPPTRDDTACAETGERFATLTSPDYFRDKLPTENALEITEEVPIFDAANLLVVNDRQLLYLTSISGNYSGFVQLKEHMQANHGMEVLPMSGVYSGLHIDPTICVLNERTILSGSEE